MAKKPITRLASEMARLPAAPFIPGVTWNNPAPTTAFGAAGSKPFVGDPNATQARRDNNDAYMAGLNSRVPVQNMNDLSSPAWWIKNTLKGGKEAVVDPILNLPNAFDPTSGLSPMERVNTGLGGGLALADAITPFLPEGALANAMVRNATNKAIAETAAARTVAPRFNNMMLSNGQMLPRNAATVQYAEALRRMQNELKLLPDQTVASIQMQGSQFPSVMKSGEYNPNLAGASGYRGVAQQLADRAGVSNPYETTRKAIESYLGGDTYGMLRDPMDFRTGSSYRIPRNAGSTKDAMGNVIEDTYDLEKLKAWQTDQGNQVILDVRPGVGSTVTPGDSYNIWNRAKAAGYEGSYSDFVLQYDKSLPAINSGVPGEQPVIPDVYKDILTGANLRSRSPELNEIPRYAEVQMPPVPLSDVDRAYLMRDAQMIQPTYKAPTPSGWSGLESIPSPTPMRVMAQNRAMAKAARAKGITPVTGVLDQAISKFGPKVVEQARASMSPDEFMKFIISGTTFTPDKVALDQIPGPQFWADMRKMAEKVIADRKLQTTPEVYSGEYSM